VLHRVGEVDLLAVDAGLRERPVEELTGNAGSITRMRGPTQLGPWPGYVTVHPSYLLRIPEADKKHEAYEAFVTDLARIREMAYVARDDAPLKLAAE